MRVNCMRNKKKKGMLNSMPLSTALLKQILLFDPHISNKHQKSLNFEKKESDFVTLKSIFLLFIERKSIWLIFEWNMNNQIVTSACICYGISKAKATFKLLQICFLAHVNAYIVYKYRCNQFISTENWFNWMDWIKKWNPLKYPWNEKLFLFFWPNKMLVEIFSHAANDFLLT